LQIHSIYFVKDQHGVQIRQNTPDSISDMMLEYSRADAPSVSSPKHSIPMRLVWYRFDYSFAETLPLNDARFVLFVMPEWITTDGVTLGPSTGTRFSTGT